MLDLLMLLTFVPRPHPAFHRLQYGKTCFLEQDLLLARVSAELGPNIKGHFTLQLKINSDELFLACGFPYCLFHWDLVP